jgi:uncharacterized protein
MKNHYKAFNFGFLSLLLLFLPGFIFPGEKIQEDSVQINGYLGKRIDQCIEHRIKKQDVDALVEPFRQQKETRLWQSEFWGKWILGAIDAYRYKQDPELFSSIQKAVDGLLATQLPNGYIGNYSEEAQLQQWDIWGRKYTLLGLMAWYDLTGDKKAIEAAIRVANHLLTQVGPGKADIIRTGNYRGMASSSILEPILKLYNRTGNPNYLDFGKWIVKRWETPDGPHLISKALEGIAVAERFPHPESWWSWENGQKAYEMMSCYEGLLELYLITREPAYLEAVKRTVSNIIESEINIAGSGTAFECWVHGKEQQTTPAYHTMETCVTITWMKLCASLLKITGDPLYADQIEKTMYNALLAALKNDAIQISKYSPLQGKRHEGEHQCGMDINCCNANGPRGFMLIPRIAMTSSANEIKVNLYGESEARFTLPQKNSVKIAQKTDYPVSGEITILVEPDKTSEFILSLRIPLWCRQPKVMVNGTDIQNLIPGSYCRIERNWVKGDQVKVFFEMKGQLIRQNGYQAIVRGPVVLARDSRFSDGDIHEPCVITATENEVNLTAVPDKNEKFWMTFTAPLILGTDLEGEFRNPREVHFCDFASAGNTWEENDRYRVWLPQTLNVMKQEYKSY